MSIARYVEPQKKYTSPKANITAKRLGRGAEIIEVDSLKYQTRRISERFGILSVLGGFSL